MGVGSVRHTEGRVSVVVCVSCKLSAKVWHVVYVVVHADEVAELKKEIEQLKSLNVALNEEKDRYSGVLISVLAVLCTAAGGTASPWLASIRGGGCSTTGE